MTKEVLDRQTTLPGRASDPGGPDLPQTFLRETKVGRTVTLAPPVDKED